MAFDGVIGGGSSYFSGLKSVANRHFDSHRMEEVQETRYFEYDLSPIEHCNNEALEKCKFETHRDVSPWHKGC